MRVIEPKVLKILGLLRSILKPAEENDVTLEKGHSVSAACWRPFLTLEPRPLSARGIQFPEVIVMVEGPLLGTTKLPSKQVNITSGATGPSMPRTRKRAIGAGDLSPLVLVDEVDEKIVVKGSQSSVEVLATEQ